MYMIATRNIQNSGQISSLENVLESIKKEAITKNKEEQDELEDIDGSWATDNNNNHHIGKETEMVVCCKSIRISSTNQSPLIHPFLVGEYTLVERELLEPIYVKTGNRRLFISKPVSQTHNLGYSWAVGNSPGAKWGYMSSSKNSLCPDKAGPWQVYEKDINIWTSDHSINLECAPETGINVK
jgi:hypothetical protein